MKMAPCPATSGSWQVLEVLGDGGSGEGPSFKKGLPPKMHFHGNANPYEVASCAQRETSGSDRHVPNI